MKKSLSFIMAIAMALCVSGCGENNSTPATTTAAPAAITTAPQTEAEQTEAPDTEAQDTEAEGGEAATASTTVTDISYVDEATGYTFTATTNLVNYIKVEIYASTDGITVTDFNRIYVPSVFTTLEEILEAEGGSNFIDRFEEVDFSGVQSWCFTSEASASAAQSFADTPFTDLYVQHKNIELTEAGMSANEAAIEINTKLEQAGFAVEAG